MSLQHKMKLHPIMHLHILLLQCTTFNVFSFNLGRVWFLILYLLQLHQAENGWLALGTCLLLFLVRKITFVWGYIIPNDFFLHFVSFVIKHRMIIRNQNQVYKYKTDALNHSPFSFSATRAKHINCHYLPNASMAIQTTTFKLAQSFEMIRVENKEQS